MTGVDAAYCIRCGTALAPRAAFGRERPCCPACGYVHFDDPKLSAGVVAARDGRILLTRRNHEPGLGKWSFPAGYVDAFEDVVEAAAREAWEETGVHVRVGQLLGVFQAPGSRVVFLAYAATAGPEAPVAGDEAFEAAYFPAGALPELAFPTDAAVLDAWRAAVAQRTER